jgi:putative peptidoglycan lipid II flippase
MAQGIGIWTVAAVRQLVAVYYALGDTRTPVLVAAADLVVFIVLALALRGPFGHVGISLAVAGASFVQMALLWILLGKKLESLRMPEVGKSASKTALAAAVASLTAILVAARLADLVGKNAVERLLPGVIGAAAFGVVFLIAARLLRSEELDTISSALLRRNRRSHP